MRWMQGLLAVALAPSAARASVPVARTDARIERAFQHYQRGESEEAGKEADRALSVRESAEAHALKGLLALRGGQPRLAAREFQRALVIDPRSSLAHEGMGRMLLRKGEPKAAVQHLRAAIDGDPCNWRAMYFLATWHQQEKRHKAAVRLLREAAVIARDGEPLSSMLWFNLGLTYAALDQHYLAARSYRRSIDIDPERIEAVNNLAVLLIDSEQYDEAEALLEQAIERMPGMAQLEYLAGAAYYLEGQSGESKSQDGGRALAHLKRARELGYAGEGLWVALAWSALGGREIDLAEECFKRVLGGTDDKAEAQKGLGYVYLRRRDLERARRYFDRSLERHPKDARALTGLASVLIEEDKLDAALVKLDEAIAVDPGHPDAVYKKGTTLMKLGRKDEARSAMDRFQELQDRLEEKKALNRNTRDALTRAQDLFQEGEYQSAADLLAQAVEENPDGKAAWLHYIQALVEAGHPRDALAASDRLLALDARIAVTHQLRARAYEALGDAAAARRERQLAATKPFASSGAGAQSPATRKTSAQSPGASGSKR